MAEQQCRYHDNQRRLVDADGRGEGLPEDGVEHEHACGEVEDADAEREVGEGLVRHFGRACHATQDSSASRLRVKE
mgnify:CR=1 FL=1